MKHCMIYLLMTPIIEGIFNSNTQGLYALPSSSIPDRTRPDQLGKAMQVAHTTVDTLRGGGKPEACCPRSTHLT